MITMMMSDSLISDTARLLLPHRIRPVHEATFSIDLILIMYILNKRSRDHRAIGFSGPIMPTDTQLHP